MDTAISLPAVVLVCMFAPLNANLSILAMTMGCKPASLVCLIAAAVTVAVAFTQLALLLHRRKKGW